MIRYSSLDVLDYDTPDLPGLEVDDKLSMTLRSKIAPDRMSL